MTLIDAPMANGSIDPVRSLSQAPAKVDASPAR